MQECNNNPIFWEALQAFLRKYKNSPTHIQ